MKSARGLLFYIKNKWLFSSLVPLLSTEVSKKLQLTLIINSSDYFLNESFCWWNKAKKGKSIEKNERFFIVKLNKNMILLIK